MPLQTIGWRKQAPYSNGTLSVSLMVGGGSRRWQAQSDYRPSRDFGLPLYLLITRDPRTLGQRHYHEALGEDFALQLDGLRG